MWPTIIASVLPGIVARVVSAALRDPAIPLDSPAPRVAVKEIEERVVREVRRVPEL